MRVHPSPPVAASYATVAKLPELLPPARLVPVTKTVAPFRRAAIAVGTSSPLRGPLYVATQSSPLLVCADAPDEEIVSSIAAARQTAEPPQSHSRGVLTAVRGLIGPTPFARPRSVPSIVAPMRESRIGQNRADGAPVSPRGWPRPSMPASPRPPTGG